MGCAIDLCLLSSMCCIHFCCSAALAHMNTLESTIGPVWEREPHTQYFTCSSLLGEVGNFCWLTTDLKHVRWMWRIMVQRDGLQGESRKGKDALQDKRTRKNRSCLSLCYSFLRRDYYETQVRELVFPLCWLWVQNSFSRLIFSSYFNYIWEERWKMVTFVQRNVFLCSK